MFVFRLVDSGAFASVKEEDISAISTDPRGEEERFFLCVRGSFIGPAPVTFEVVQKFIEMGFFEPYHFPKYMN